MRSWMQGVCWRGRRDQQTLLVSAVPTRRLLTREENVVRAAGQALFAALLGTGEVAGRYQASAALADRQGEDLRIVLRVDAPELAGLPWEAMYDDGTGGYVCRQHQLVRHVPVAAVPPPLETRLPLRVLGVISAPRGLVSAAHLGLRQHAQSFDVLYRLSHEAPSWLASQRMANDLLRRIISHRRSLTPQMRELAGAMNLPL
jgi:hypothetical protein